MTAAAVPIPPPANSGAGSGPTTGTMPAVQTSRYGSPRMIELGLIVFAMAVVGTYALAMEAGALGRAVVD